MLSSLLSVPQNSQPLQHRVYNPHARIKVTLARPHFSQLSVDRIEVRVPKSPEAEIHPLGLGARGHVPPRSLPQASWAHAGHALARGNPPRRRPVLDPPLLPPSEAAPTGARAAAGTGAGATALIPSGSGRRRGIPSSRPGQAGRGWERPVPGGSGAPARAVSPGRMPLRGKSKGGRNEKSRTGEAVTPFPRIWASGTKPGRG